MRYHINLEKNIEQYIYEIYRLKTLKIFEKKYINYENHLSREQFVV